MQVNTKWFNPNASTSALDYNPIDQRIYFYNKGQMLSVNVRTEHSIPATSTTAATTTSTSNQDDENEYY